MHVSLSHSSTSASDENNIFISHKNSPKSISVTESTKEEGRYFLPRRIVG
jgi:hypothetical protein